MATHFSILAWRISWTEEPVRLQSIESQELDTTEAIQHTYMQVKFQVILVIIRKINNIKDYRGDDSWCFLSTLMESKEYT